MKFDRYHPIINFIFFTFIIIMTVYFKHPVYVIISFFTSFVYSVKLNGVKSFIFNIVFMLSMSLFIFYYVSFNHFGVTNLKTNFVGNNITLESLCYAIILSLIICSVVMWFSCVHSIFSADKITYLFGKIIPKLSLYIAIILRTVPRIKYKWNKIAFAQKCIGKGVNQGNLFIRIVNVFRIISILFTWIIDNFLKTSESMKNRGYTLKKRTNFSIYRFNNNDRILVIIIFMLSSILLIATFFDQVNILYNPKIVFNQITIISYIFYFVYAFFCVLPMLIQIILENRFKKLRSK